MKNITISQYEKFISKLTKNEELSFYELLAYNLTISCRGIWSNDELTIEEKLDGLKCVNEIQHRLIMKIHNERLSLHEYSKDYVYVLIEGHSKGFPKVVEEIEWALIYTKENI